MWRSNAGPEVFLYPLPAEPVGLSWARDALVNWMAARHGGGRLYLLAGDPRVVEELAWLGLEWDGVAEPAWEETLESLVARGAALEGEEGIRLVPPPSARQEAPLARPAQGAGSPLLRDAAGRPTPLLLTVLADRDLGTGERMRSREERHLSAWEAALHRLLDSRPPRFTHLAAILGSEGVSLAALREEGMIPEGVLSYLAELGWRDPRGERCLTRPELSLRYTPEGLLRDEVAFSRERLEEVHRIFLEELTPAELVARSRPFLPGRDLSHRQQMELEALALLYGEQARTLRHFSEMVRFYFQDPDLSAHREAFPAARRHLQDLLPRLEALEQWDSLPLEELLGGLEEAARRALELALTGRSDTPGLPQVAALVGREAVLRRLRVALEL